MSGKKELENYIRQEFANSNLKKATKEETERAVRFLKAEYRSKKRTPRCSFLYLLLVQLRLGAGRIWIVQGGILFLFWGLIKAIYHEQMKALLIRHLPFFLASFSLFLVMLSIPWIYRSVHYKMLETEYASRFSLGNLILARFLILGVGDGVILTVVLGGFTIGTEEIVKNTLLWGILSFLVGAVVLTALLARGLFKQLYFFYGGFWLACSALLLGIETRAPKLMEQTVSSVCSVGGLLCMFLAGLLYIELRKLRKGVELWNFKLMSL